MSVNVVVFYNVSTLLQSTYFARAKKKLLPQGMGDLGFF
jgi:hypothetical protein